MAGSIRIDTHDGWATVWLDNIERRNAVTPTMLQEISQVFLDLGQQSAYRAIVLRGVGGVFCAGFDVSALPAADEIGADAEDFPGADVVKLAADAIDNCDVPVVAALEGPCFGAGAELALAADFRIADTKLKICMPPSRLGLVYAVSGLQRFVRTVGLQLTRDMFMTARVLDGTEALQRNLVDRLADGNDFEKELNSFVRSLTANAPLSLRGTKKILRDHVTAIALPDEALRAIAQIRMEAFRSQDHAEGKAAFAEKRTPEFTGS